MKLEKALCFISVFFISVFIISISSVSAQHPVSYDVSPNAKITKVSYYLKKFKGRETLHFEVGVKNICKDAKRFKLTVDIPDGPVASYFYPRKGKPPVIKSGSEFMKPLPLVFYDKLPNSFKITVIEAE